MLALSLLRTASAGPSTFSQSSKIIIRHASNGNGKPLPHIPVIRTLGQLRRWRQEAREKGLEVGVVPTMGALHEGHVNLVRTSISKHPLTVMTLFVNPMQFAPHEDLSSYPRNFERDVTLLQSILPLPTSPRQMRGLGSSPLVIFAPTPDVIYPLKGELQDLRSHKGVEVDVRGWAEVMEGASRPQFFKGVATVCTKLFNAVEPDHAYFGQKDIQQALLLKILVKDLLLSHPTSENLHILPTTRSSEGLALSSRNSYLSKSELQIAPILYKALSTVKKIYESNENEIENENENLTGEDLISKSIKIILKEKERILSNKNKNENELVELNLDYIEIFDKNTFEPIRGKIKEKKNKEFIIAGAIWVGKTRLIDNLLIGWEIS
uniref:Pantoate--beta-alanine ligase n=1 Tax=Kwoniella pini CBS 10737 TaxID=1296096 RepID=A0A1B9HWD5_9TREE|nr:pantoate-beta-alanine ligase [Kwoniella pini CBS 10737]OCF47587.1 pantoate-beta-alanine ligase [Kwoniella pini CBS 10737]